jgi:Domain of unknown function (DUF4156)
MRSRCAAPGKRLTFIHPLAAFRRKSTMRTSRPVISRALSCVALTAAAFAVAGCHNVKLTPQAEAVRVLRDPTQVTRCRFVDDVVSSDRLSGGLINRELAEENAYKILKQKTAKLGANTVLVSASTSGIQGAGMKGKAYQCAGS